MHILLVFKKFRSLLASPELYNTRILLGGTENCLYVCLQFSCDSNTTRWFTLCRRPKPNPRWFIPCFAPYRILKNCTKKNERKSSDNILVSIPSLDSFSTISWSLIADDCNIYKIGRCMSPSRILFIGCRSHTWPWHEAPNMLVTRKWPVVNVFDGKIYVAEDSKDFDLSNWMECFDPKTQIWKHVPSPSADIRGSFVSKSLVIEGKLYMVWDRTRCAFYKPKENKWEKVELIDVPNSYGLPKSSCVIDNVLYNYKSGNLEWYNSEGRYWRILEGLEVIQPKLRKRYDGVRLIDYSGKIAVFWDKFVHGKMKIWCAKIALESCA